jgi:hypothetical protein
MPRAQPTRDYHPSTRKRAPAPAGRAGRVEIPPHVNDVEVAVGDRTVRLTNLTKICCGTTPSWRPRCCRTSAIAPW